MLEDSAMDELDGTTLDDTTTDELDGTRLDDDATSDELETTTSVNEELEEGDSLE
jgi:hypothetical protein